MALAANAIALLLGVALALAPWQRAGAGDDQPATRYATSGPAWQQAWASAASPFRPSALLWPSIRLSWSETAAQETLRAAAGHTVTYYMFLEGPVYDGIVISILQAMVQYTTPPMPRTYTLGFPGRLACPAMPLSTSQPDTIAAFASYCMVYHMTPTLLLSCTFTVPSGSGPFSVILRDDISGWQPGVDLCFTCDFCYYEPSAHNSLVLLPQRVGTTQRSWGTLKAAYRSEH